MPAIPSADNPYLTLPFPQSECAAHGIVEVECDVRWPRITSFVVDDPQAASRWLPAAEHFAGSTTVFAPGSWRDALKGLTCFHVSRLGSFKSLPPRLCLDASNEFVFMWTYYVLADKLAEDFVDGWLFRQAREIEAPDDSGHRYFVQFPNPPVPIYVARTDQNEGLYPDALIPAGHPVPTNAVPRAVFSGNYGLGDSLCYRAADLFPGTPPHGLAAAARKAIARRTKEVKDRCPHLFPEGWTSYSKSDLDDLILWNCLVSQGWVPFSDLLDTLSLSRSDAAQKALCQITQSRHFEHDELDSLFRPVSFDDIARSGKMVPFLKTLCPDGVEFVSRCVTSDQARSGVLAEILAAGVL